MNLEQLLNITSLDTIVKVDGIKNRVRENLIVMNYINEYNITESWKYDDFIKEHGEKKILSQSIEDNKLVILINLN